MQLAQKSFPLWRELEAECGMPLLDLHGTLDLGNWAPNRDALTACDVPFEVLDAGQIEHRFGIQTGPGDHGLYRRTAAPIVTDAAVEALGARLEVREGCRVEAVEQDDDGVGAGGVRARVAVGAAGAWAPTLAGVDATPTVETARTGPRPLRAVRDGPTAGGKSGYALAATPSGGLKAGLPVRPPPRPRRGQRPRSRAGCANGGLGGAPLPGSRPGDAHRDVPLHDA